MFFRFIPTRSTVLRTKTARDSRVSSTIVPVVGVVASLAITTRILPWTPPDGRGTIISITPL